MQKQKFNISACKQLISRYDPYVDILIFALCLFGGNILWKWMVQGEETETIVFVLGCNATSFFDKIASYVAHRAFWIISFFRPSAIMCEPDTIYFETGFATRIVWACTAVKQSFIWLIIMAFARGKQVRKLWYIPLGWLLLHVFNVLRIATIGMLCEHHPTMFDFWHSYFFKYLFYILMFMLWVLWNERLNARHRNPRNP